MGLSDQILQMSTGYLGPAAKKFLDRQCKAHLGIDNLDAISPDKIPELAKWINVSAGLIIDKDKAKELSDKVSTLA